MFVLQDKDLIVKEVVLSVLFKVVRFVHLLVIKFANYVSLPWILMMIVQLASLLGNSKFAK